MWEWNEEDTPSKLISAVAAGDIKRVKQLIAEGADVNERQPSAPEDDMTVTPLGVAFSNWAYEGEDLDVFDLLLSAGASTDYLIQFAEEDPFDLVDSLNEMRDHIDPEELVPLGKQVLDVLKKRGIEIDMSRYYLTEEELSEGA